MINFRKGQVIMLPTDDITLFYKWGNNLYYNCLEKSHVNTQADSQHLYIISDDEIKENDWCLNLENNHYFQATYTDINNIYAKNVAYRIKGIKKIILSTDKFLNLPQPSQQFVGKYIEEYNKSNVIKDVLVEYILQSYSDRFEDVEYIGKPETWGKRLKINSKDNTVIIKEVKDTYSHEEVEKLCRYAWKVGFNVGYYEDTQPSLLTADNWVKENL